MKKEKWVKDWIKETILTSLAMVFLFGGIYLVLALAVIIK